MHGQYQLGAWSDALDQLGIRDAALAAALVAELQRRKLAALRVEAAVEHVVVSGALGRGKPDPGIFLHAARLFRTPARACLMVGNSLEHDVAGARAAGMRAVWFAHEEVPGTPPAATAGVPPDHVIGCLAELLTLPAVRRAPR